MRTEGQHVPVEQTLSQMLHFRIDGTDEIPGVTAVSALHHVPQVGRVEWHLGPCSGDRFQKRPAMLFTIDIPPVQHAAEHIITPDACAHGVPVRPDPGGGVGQDRQERGLPGTKVGGGPAVVEESRRFDSLDVPAIRRQVQIAFQYLILREPPLQLESPERLHQFGPDRPRFRIHESGDLLGDGGAAAHDPPASDVLDQGPDGRDRIDTRMPAEPAIFKGKRGFDHMGRNILECDREMERFFAGDIHPQGMAIPVEDPGLTIERILMRFSLFKAGSP